MPLKPPTPVTPPSHSARRTTRGPKALLSLRALVRRAIGLRAAPSRFVEPVAVLVMLAIALSVYRQPVFIWSTPDLRAVVGASISLALLLRRLPVLASLFHLLGAGSLLWTLTPANTLLNSLWELVYLAAFASGGSVIGFSLINASLLLFGLERTLLLDIFRLTEYFSGSTHYLAGAQGLLFLPLCLSTATRSTKWPNRIAATLAAAACLLLVLNSGARSVYLPALLVVPLTVLRLALPGAQRLRALAVPVVALSLVSLLAVVLPGPTVSVPLRVKGVDASTQVRTQVQDFAPSAGTSDRVVEEGGIASRLKMWEQTLHIGIDNPWGTGAGSFRNVVHAFQEFPLIGFSSAHNIFLEVFATGGWPRLIVLVLLLAIVLSKGWSGPRWPVAIGSAGIWATMCFDITYQMPGIMVLAFWSLGASRGKEEPHETVRRRIGVRTALAIAVLTVSAAFALWWYAPCQGVDCAARRHLGNRPEMLDLARSLEGAESRRVAERAVELNPRSAWAWQLLAEQSREPAERLEATRELARRFPLMSPANYLRWAEAALEVGEVGEARTAVLAGLEVFPPGFSPAGVPMGGRAASHRAWLEAADRILRVTEPAQ
jgi:O-antigen ligase